MSFKLVTIPIGVLLWFAVPLVFSVAFFLWWRRLRHWSFAFLSGSTLLEVFAQMCSFLAVNIPRFGKSPEQVAATPDLWLLLQMSLVLHLVMGAGLLIGGLGLAAAARDDLLFRDPK
jgi:hypothetical protein